jgi:ABC-2 type transport system permease protein
MHKFLATLQKEILLLIRDLPGLAILFLMPVLLILVVTLAQENALKNQGAVMPVLFADGLNSPFSASLANNLDSSGMFLTVRSVEGKQVTIKEVQRQLAAGNFKFGIILKPTDSAIVIMVDPALQPAYRRALVNSLTYIIRGTQSRSAIEDLLTATAGDMKPVIQLMISNTLKNLPPVQESFAVNDKSATKPSPIQNNVPGFILFAMFFIVIPLSGSLISEKNEGGYQRLRTLPVGVLTILSGKISLYLLVCLLQFIVMLLVGCWAFPTFFGLPGLELGSSWGAIALATVAASLAAIGFGTIVGAVSTTHNQAALFGSVMVVLLGIISGTFLPIHIMPEFIQYLSYLSPIRWGIDNYLDIFIREGTVLTILPRSFLLLSFFVFAMMVSIVIFANRKQ